MSNLERSRRWLWIAAATVGPLLAGNANAADRLVLRNGEQITDRTVVKVDEDGAQLSEPTARGVALVRWDEIESGAVNGELQTEFDRLRGEIGDDLFRIRWRLQVGDYDALREPAERLYGRFQNRRSLSALMVCTATLWGRIAEGDRESAVEPLLRVMELVRSGAVAATDLPGPRPLNVNAEQGYSSDLLPIWFDPEAAKRALPEVLATIRTIEMPRPEGVRIYYGALAAAAGDAATAKQMLDAQPKDETLVALRLAVLASVAGENGAKTAAIERLDHLRSEGRFPADVSPALLYAWGTAKTAGSDPRQIRDGALALLEIAARHGHTNRELAAAGLYQAAEALDKLKDTAGARAVRRELQVRFAETAHARKK